MTALRNRVVLCFAWTVFMASATNAASSSAVLNADIAPQPLAEALEEFGRQTQLQFIFVSTVANTQHSNGARAGVSLSDALAQLLDGTGLMFEFLNVRTVRVYAAPKDPSATPPVSGSSRQYTMTREALRPLALEEVMVTATRREEQLNRVPISMVVWSQEALDASGIKTMTQIADHTPAVDFSFSTNVGGDFQTSLAIRGVAERHGTGVGIYLDDAPLPPAWSDSNLRSFPVTFDLDRVEILRGPQATLLGDHTQGGAVRFIANQPSLSEPSGFAHAEWTTTAHGGMGYEAGAAVGGPVVPDVLGFRVSGWYQSEDGYVDRVDALNGATVDANSNRYLSKSFRGALTFAPEGSVRITPSLTYQAISIRDTSSFDTALSDPADGVLRNDNFRQQPFQDTFYLASLRVNAGLGAADLSAVTSFFDDTATSTMDASQDSADLAAYYLTTKQREFAQEVRLTSDAKASLTWLLGAFFSRDHTHIPVRVVGLIALGPTTVPVPTDAGDETDIGKSELDGFGEVALKLTKNLTASAGLRVGHTEYDGATQAPPSFHAAGADTWTAPRFVLSYLSGEHNLVYVSAAKGYGSGGVYWSNIFTSDSPEAYGPETLWSYEIGTKSVLWGGRIGLDTSVFHIRWNNGQQVDVSPRAENPMGPGAAMSNGFELAAHALFTEHAIASLDLAYTDAHYTQTVSLPTVCCGEVVTVRSGDAVGFGSPWSVTASFERQFLIHRGLIASFRAEDIFHSHNTRPFHNEDPTSSWYEPGWHPDPSTNILNARATLKWSSFDAAVFVNNALDSQPALAVTAAPGGAVRGAWAHTLTPRTVGLSGTWRF